MEKNLDTGATDDRCEHFELAGNPPPRTKGCEECMALGEKWVALRVCLSCGHVGCCEDSPHAHAFAHFQTTGHPIIRPLERGHRWTWCYVHNRYFKWMPGPIAGGSGRISGWLRRLRRP
jgi:ubiquitin-hydrolase Zn-finger-containing protein